MTKPRQVAEMLGGAKVLKHKVMSIEDLIALTHEGLPHRALEVLAKKLEINPNHLTTVLSTTRKTLDRHKAKGRHSSVLSDRVMRLARVAARTEEVFGNTDKAKAWLHRTNPSLGGTTPLLMIATEIGTAEVIDLLGRIEYGVFG